MSYDYFLVRLKKPYIKSLREFDSADVVEDWGYSMEEVKNILNELYPSAKNHWEFSKITYKDEDKPSLCGQVLDGPGRFEFVISDYLIHDLTIRGSHHVNQEHEIFRIAKALRLSAFDVQTGERIYLQN